MTGSSSSDSGNRRIGRVVQVASLAEARAQLERDVAAAAIVGNSGVVRNALLHCPCGCGDVLNINLDRRAGKAWRARVDAYGLSVTPSVWRSTGCGSHFVVWRSEIWWCRWNDDSIWPDEMDEELRSEWRRLREDRKERGDGE